MMAVVAAGKKRMGDEKTVTDNPMRFGRFDGWIGYPDCRQVSDAIKPAFNGWNAVVVLGLGFYVQAIHWNSAFSCIRQGQSR